MSLKWMGQKGMYFISEEVVLFPGGIGHHITEQHFRIMIPATQDTHTLSLSCSTLYVLCLAELSLDTKCISSHCCSFNAKSTSSSSSCSKNYSELQGKEMHQKTLQSIIRRYFVWLQFLGTTPNYEGCLRRIHFV